MNVGAWLLLGLFWVALLALVVWLVVRLLLSGNRLVPGADRQSRRRS